MPLTQNLSPLVSVSTRPSIDMRRFNLERSPIYWDKIWNLHYERRKFIRSHILPQNIDGLYFPLLNVTVSYIAMGGKAKPKYRHDIMFVNNWKTRQWKSPSRGGEKQKARRKFQWRICITARLTNFISFSCYKVYNPEWFFSRSRSGELCSNPSNYKIRDRMDTSSC